MNNFKAVFKHFLFIVFASITMVSSAFAAISSISPNAGGMESYTTVIITGTNFTGTTAVTFDGDPADTFTVDSATQITARAGARFDLTGGGSKVVDVVVTTPGGPVTSVGGFTYVDQPMFWNVSPNSGSAAGGTIVTLTGENYIGVTAVKFGGVAAASYTVDSDTQITAVTPAGTVGSSSVNVTTVGGSDTWNGGYTYVAAAAPPTVTSATYDASAGALVVTGTNFTAIGGATNDVIANKFTFTGEGDSTYTLTDTANVEIVSDTSFTLTLSATDRAAVNLIVNKNGTSSTSGTTYNLAGAAGFIADSAATADTTGNGITVSSVTVPTITSATYNHPTGVLVVTGTGFLKLSGATNDIDVSKLTLTGEGGVTRTLTTSGVEISSATSFSVTLIGADRLAVNQFINKAGTSSTSGTTYNLAAAEDWAAGADTAVVVADLTGNGITATVPAPTITNASSYNGTTGVLTVTGTGLPSLAGATNDIDVSKLTVTGEGGVSYTLTTTNVELTSAAAFSVTLNGTDLVAVNQILNKNGISSTDGTSYNLAAAEDWAAGADSAVVVADLTSNRITVSNAVSVPATPTIGTATAGNGQVSVAFSAPVSNGGSAITGYTVTSSPSNISAGGNGFTTSPITVTGLTNGVSYTFTVTATNSAGEGAASAASNAVTPRAAQTINFTNPGEQIVGATVTLSATASSGSPPSFSSATPAVCTVAGAQATMVAVGTCTINASESGSAAFESASTSQSFVVKPEPNKVPVITQGGSSSVTVAEDDKAVFSLSATDANNEALSWTIQAQPQHGTAEVGITGGTSYTPEPNFEGTDSFVVAVTDGKDVATNTVTVTVAPVNDVPTMSGIPATSIKVGEPYSFAPVGKDVDKDAVLTFGIINKPSWASFDPATGVLSGTPATADIGSARDIVLSVSDGTEKASLPAFSIKVVSADPGAPNLKVPADVSLEANALYTAVNLRQLLGLSASASQAELDKALQVLAVDGTGNACCTVKVEGAEGDVIQLASGNHEIKWTAKTAAGLSVSDTQRVSVQPLVSLNQSQIAVRGTDTEFKVLLNGVSPVYPLTIAYEIDSATTATAVEYSLSNGTVTFTDGQLEAVVPVSLKDVILANETQIVVKLAGDINRGSNASHTISLRSGNLPPVINLALKQGGVLTSLVSPSDGPVTVTAEVSDANQSDKHTFNWSATSGLADSDGKADDASRTFDVTGLTGSHQVLVTVTDSAGASVQSSVYFRVVSALPVLSDVADTDKDGLVDKLEGTGDADDNGIPDYLDNMPSPNILPQQGVTTNAYLIECDPGVRCGLGLFARSGSSGGVQLLDSEIGTLKDLVIDPAFEPVGGVFDFAIRDLPTPGQSVRVVIPQRAAIPANAVYRKYQRGRWVNFAVDANNAVHTAAGNPGYCPPPGAAEWIPGLTAGHLCVQLTIQDGGANDDDGLVNAAVVDPGSVSVAKVVVPPVEPPEVEIKAKRGGTMSELWLLLLAGLLMLNRTNSKRLVTVLLSPAKLTRR